MNSEFPANPPGVVVDVARGADLINALLRTRFLAGTAADAFGSAEVAFESARKRLPRDFFGALTLGRRGVALELFDLPDEEVGSESMLPTTRACVAEKLEYAESESSWLLSSEFRTCSGNARAGSVEGPRSSPNTSTEVSEFSRVMAVVSEQ